MKVGTTELVKFRHLKRALGLPHFAIVGLLEALWMFALKNAPQGDIGKHSNEDIACMIEWDGDPDELIDALLKYQWLDAHTEHRLVIHDWSDHAPNWLKGNLASHGKQFANASLQPAKQRAHSTLQAATNSSPLNSRQSPPPQYSGESATTQTSGKDDWQEVVVLLGNAGLAAASQTARDARQKGYSTTQMIELCDELAKRPQLGPEALAWRIQNVAPKRPSSEGWPESKPTTKPAPEIDIGRYTAAWSKTRPSQRVELARKAQVDLTGFEGQGLRELPGSLRLPLVELLAREAGDKPPTSNK